MDMRRRPLPAVGGFAGVHLGGLADLHTALAEQGAVEESPEERREEHDLRGDEQGHAIAQAELDHLVVKTVVLRFADHVAPPYEHGEQEAQETGERDIRPGKAVDPQDGPART